MILGLQIVTLFLMCLIGIAIGGIIMLSDKLKVLKRDMFKEHHPDGALGIKDRKLYYCCYQGDKLIRIRLAGDFLQYRKNCGIVNYKIYTEAQIIYLYITMYSFSKYNKLYIINPHNSPIDDIDVVMDKINEEQIIVQDTYKINF